MEKDQETMEGLLHCLDDSIALRDRRCQTLDTHYKDEEGRILKKEFDEYSKRKNSISNRFESEVIDYQKKIDRLCGIIRKRQPSLMELSPDNINTKGRFPRNIALGKLHVTYHNLDFFVPKSFSFPFEKPMYICDESKTVLLHKVLLRLLFALPIDKQECYIFDPIGLGKTVSKFNSLFSNENLFPQKKILSSIFELKDALRDVMEYILDLQSHVFNIKTNCQDWDSYNRMLYSKRELRRMLPYKVFIFTSVPDGMDEDCFTMFRKLIVHGRQCGLLVLFSFNEAILNTDDFRIKKTETELKSCIEDSVQLHQVFEEDTISNGFQYLNIDHVGEKFPDDDTLSVLLEELNLVAEKQNKQGMTFDEIMGLSPLFTSNSRDGLAIPVGCGVSGNGIVKVNIGDETPHYLIGGATGSGKSNFLHNLIMSACCRYSPNELRVYLLDFKEGVEFSQYAKPALRHAKLVAMEADTEYGVTVLKHLVEEKEKRYDAFKDCGCKDIQGYRDKKPDAVMPRILVVIDEFQVLFGNDQADQTLVTLTMLAKQGRACGIHLVLATQSLRGIQTGRGLDNFSTVAAQFGGRVALRCSVEDSKRLLGGLSSNNEAAAELKIPFAILNTSQGSVDGNQKFMIPRAEEKKISEWVRKIAETCDRSSIETETKVFEGQRLPERPSEYSERTSEGLQIFFGEKMDYQTDIFSVTLRPRRSTENLLICGHNDLMKKSMFRSVVLSALASDCCDEVIYVGDPYGMIEEQLSSKIICLDSMKDFCERYEEHLFEKKTVLIMDNCDLTRQIGYTSTGTPKDNAAIFKKYLSEANGQGSYLIAFYEGTNRIKSCGVPKDEFNYRIGYHINAEERNFLLTNSYSSALVKPNRAFFVENQELKNWFRPYSV